MTASIASARGKKSPGPTIEQFEALDVVPGEFDHEAHVYVAWSYLRGFDVLASIGRYRSVLQKLTEKFGVPGKYHETMTWFYLLAVAERATGKAATDWNAFKRQNPDLFSQSTSVISQYYSERRLMSHRAITSFVLPDLAPSA
jgi:hypothetical protein